MERRILELMPSHSSLGRNPMTNSHFQPELSSSNHIPISWRFTKIDFHILIFIFVLRVDYDLISSNIGDILAMQDTKKIAMQGFTFIKSPNKFLLAIQGFTFR